MGIFDKFSRRKQIREQDSGAPVIPMGGPQGAPEPEGPQAPEDVAFARAYQDRIEQDRGMQQLAAQIDRARAEMQTAAQSGDYARADKAKQRVDALEARRDKEEAKVREELAKSFDRERRRLGHNPFGPGEEEPPEVDWVRDDDASQRVVPYTMLYADGIMRLDDERWSYSVTFEDTNYTSAREDDQADIVTSYRHWLNGLSADMDVEFTFVSKHVDRRTFVSNYALSQGGDGLDVYRDELNAYVQDKISAAASSMLHDRIMTLTTKAQDHDGAARAFAGELKRFGRFLRQYNCSYHALTGQERMDLLNSITKPDEERHKYTYNDLQENPGMMTRDLVAPWSVWRCKDGAHDSRLVVGGRWVKSYTIIPTGWGNTMRDDLLNSITAISHDLVVSFHVDPWDVAEGVKAAADHYISVVEENNNYKQMHSKPERGFFIDDSNMPPAMREAEEGAKATRDSLSNRNERFFGVTFVVTLMCRSEAELEDASRELESIFQTQNKPGAESWVMVREQSYATVLPLGNNVMPKTYARNMTTNGLSALVPFASADFQDQGGLLLGTNDETHNLILYDRPSHEHTNAFILGQPGGGKSVVAKLQMLQLRLSHPEADQIVLDPEGEYMALTQALGGQVVSVSESSGEHVNPMDISEYYGSVDPDSETNPVPSKVNFVQHLVAMMAPSVSDEERGILDEACSAVYADWMETREDSDIPTLDDVYEYLVNLDGGQNRYARHLSELVKRYVKGSFNVFNHRTNVDLDNSLVDFSLVDMSNELKPLAMLVLLDQIWVRVTQNRSRGRQTWLWIDEMQILINDENCADTLDIFWTRGRKWGLFNNGITQNAERLLTASKTEYMFNNSACFQLTRQSNESANILAEKFSLSDDQEMLLETCPKGEGIAVIDKKPVHYNFFVSESMCPEIYRLITTTPADANRLAMRRKARRDGSGEVSAVPEAGGTMAGAEGADMAPEAEPPEADEGASAMDALMGQLSDLDEPDGVVPPVGTPDAGDETTDSADDEVTEGAAEEAQAEGHVPEEPDGADDEGEEADNGPMGSEDLIGEVIRAVIPAFGQMLDARLGAPAPGAGADEVPDSDQVAAVDQGTGANEASLPTGDEEREGGGGAAEAQDAATAAVGGASEAVAEATGPSPEEGTGTDEGETAGDAVVEALRSEIEALKARIAELDGTREERDAARDALAQARDDLAGKSGELASAHSQLGEARERARAAEAERDSAVREREDAEARATLAEQGLDEANATLQEVRDQLTTSQAAQEAMRSDLDGKAEDLAKAREESAGARREAADASDRADNATRALEDAKAEAEELRRRDGERSELLGRLESRLAKAEAGLSAREDPGVSDELRKRLDATSMELARAKESAQRNADAELRARARAERAEGNAAEVSARIADRNAEIKRLSDQLEASRAANDKLGRQLEEETRRADEATSRAEGCEARADAAQRKADEGDEDLASARREAEAARDALAEANGQLATLRSRLDEAGQAKAALAAQGERVAALESQLEASKARAKELEYLADRAREDAKASVQDHVSVLLEQATGLNQMVADYKGQVRDLKDQLRARSEDAEELRRQRDEADMRARQAEYRAAQQARGRRSPSSPFGATGGPANDMFSQYNYEPDRD